MVRKTGQIIRRGPSTWLVRIYVGRDPETRGRKYVGKFIHGGLRSAQAHLNRKLAERDLGRNIRSSRQTVGQYLDHWLDICARPRLRAKSFRDYSSLLARYVRPHLGLRSFGELSPAEIQKLYSELLNRKLSPRTICYTHAVLFSALRQAVRWKLLLTNPAEDVHLPRQPRRRFTVFDVGHARREGASNAWHITRLIAIRQRNGQRAHRFRGDKTATVESQRQAFRGLPQERPQFLGAGSGDQATSLAHHERIAKQVAKPRQRIFTLDVRREPRD